ncbi:BRD4-interacting chromatin-remodeling complex-associated protein isoform X2 [Cebidichthys violaceus]|uniref:BRD4-interacting chromatin-remodeling complex-associated protein isoform X2 n=1 Tax=Cebidichthys violaceus TaxID=271503 RepID=UPI0035CB39BC
MGPLTYEVVDMEDEDGTCLLDVLCDPQALNDFLHGTNELQTEDLLISSSSGEPSLFTDAPSPVSLLGDGRDSPDTPPPECVDLSFLEEALLSSPEGGEDQQVVRGGTPVEAAFEPKKGEAEEAEVACDILQQSLQEAEITEQTMALEAELAQPGDSLSLYSPAPLLPPPTVPFIPKSVTLPITQALPRDTQAAVEPPQPSLLAVGPGCPSLKPAAPPQLMGLLPGNVFPAASPETSFSLTPAQASSMIIHKAVPSVTSRPLITPTLRAAAAPGLILQRAPLPIQPKLPISIQPRLVQISPKPSGQKHTPGLTFLPGTASPNILLSQPPGQKPAAPPAQPSQQLHKQVSLQLVNQGGSFVLQPQGLFQGQNQFLLPGQSPVTISQSASTARPLLTPSHHGSSLHSVNASTGQLVEGSQILTVPQRQLNFSPVFTTPSGQLALRQATVLSGPLQLQSAPPTVFQMPAQLAGTYTPGGQGQRTTLVHSPALGNHITLINSSRVLTPDLTSISIVNGPSVVQGLPFAAQAQTGVTEGQLSLQQASVVLLPERAMQEERTGSEETFHQLSQPYGHVLQHVSVQPASAGLQSSPPPVITVLQPPPEPPLAPDPAAEIPKLLMPPADMTQAVEEVTHSMSQNEAFMQHLQQQALSSPITSELLVGSLPVVPMESLASPVSNERETQPQTHAVSGQDARTAMSDQCVEASPLRSDSVDTPLICSPSPIRDTERPAPTSFSPQIPPPGPEGSVTAPQTRIEPQVQYQVPHQLRVSQALFAQNQVQIEPSVSQPPPQLQVQPSVSQPQSSVNAPVHSSPPTLRVSVPQQQSDPTAASACLSKGGDESAVQQHTQNKPTAALVVESKAFTLDVHPPSPAAPGVQGHGAPGPIQTSQNTGTKLADPLEQQTEERLTPAMRRHRFQQQICLDHAAVQTPFTGPAFSTLKDAVRRMLPYHSCAGHLPTQEDFNLVDQEFDTVSGFLLKRTKDMVNKYRQLLVREAQESPSAEMVMLERLFLQAERCALAEDRRRVRRDPESFMTALATSASSPHGAPSSGSSQRCASGSPSPPPAWTRLSDRPPGLKTYRSSSRGALRLTIKQESGSRKVVHNSACDPGLKRDHTGQLTNGGGAVSERHSQAPNGAPPRPQRDEEGSNGALLCNAAEDVPQTAPYSKTKAPNPLSMPEPQVGCFELPPRDVSAPKLKCYRLDESPRPEQRFSPPPPPLQEDNMLSEHLQSAIDSILELQRLQGPSAAPTRATSGPSLDQAVTSILEGHL